MGINILYVVAKYYTDWFVLFSWY